jgi:hypothetical protein
MVAKPVESGLENCNMDTRNFKNPLKVKTMAIFACCLSLYHLYYIFHPYNSHLYHLYYILHIISFFCEEILEFKLLLGYHLSLSSSLFCSGYFGDRDLPFAHTGLKHDLPVLCFLQLVK